MSAADTTTVRRAALIAAEVGLIVLAFGVLSGFNRVFTGWSWWAQLAVPVVVAWAMSITTRRLRCGAALSTVLQVAAAVLVLGWVFLGDHLRLGVPAAGAWSEAAYQIRASFSPFAQLIAPVPPSTGFLLVIAAGMWAMVVFADVAAIRFRSPAQAALPYLATFVAIGLLARDSGRASAAVFLGLSLVVFAVSQRVLAASELRWVHGRVAAGTRAVAVTTLLVAMVAVAAGALGGRLLPGGDEPVLDLRGYARRDDRRTLVSPFVSIRSLLGERSDQVMFRVESAEPSYWRLTALDRYDETQDIWVSLGSYSPVEGELDPVLDPSVETATLTQSFRIDGLAAGWLPAAYAPAAISSTAEVRFDRDSASLLTNDRSSTDDPVEYDLRSEIPDFTGAFQELDPTVPDGAREELDPELSRQIDLAPEVREAWESALRTARTVESMDTDDPVQQLRVLQDWFRREFSYDDTVDFADADDPLAEFIDARRGFCQQFSSAFALIARSLGFPSRVAVGFTPGDLVPAEDGASEYVVRGRHAHAWPEVHLSGAGWVPFEPTPQRGDPQGEDHTGVAPEQAPPPVEPATTTTVAAADESDATTSTLAPRASVAAGAVPQESEPPRPSPVERSERTVSPAGVALIIAATGLAALIGFLGRRRSRRGSSQGPAELVADAWAAALRSLARTGRRPGVGDTPVDFARRVDGELGELLLPLARIETRRRYGPGTPVAEDASRAQAQAERVGEVLRTDQVRRRRRGGAGGPSPSSRRR